MFYAALEDFWLTSSPWPTTAQTAYPTSDISVGLWTTVPLWSKINETTYNDTNFIQSSLSPATADISEVKLGSLTDPSTGGGHIVRYRYYKDQNTGDRIDLTVSLIQGTTVIASWTHTDISSVLSVTTEQVLTTTQADAITDYTDLRLRFSAVKV